jgi:UDP-2,3-diacylglucosamine pyrophosphatase LpxH
MDMDAISQERTVRTLIVSDLHLGARYSQAENFLAYINTIRPEQVFVLGDFLDGWKIRARWHWRREYTGILRRLFDWAESGVELFYTPGNHDDFLRCPELSDMLSKSGVQVSIRDEFVFKSLDGRRFLAFHGDKFDTVETRFPWLSHALTHAYDPLLTLNSWTNWWRGEPRGPYALCAAVKYRVKAAVRFLSHFEEQLERYTRERGCDGVICGHLHTPRAAMLGRLAYFNSGDWVENCTALVERLDGRLVLESFFSAGAVESEVCEIASPANDIVTTAAS